MLPLTKREGAGAPPEPARFDPAPGAVLAEKYRIDRKLGEGGMGVVVAATHLGLDQPVAIKFLLPEAMRSKVAVERFQREARVAARVRSEHVARVHDVGTAPGGVPYIVMEHLVGRDLGRTIAEGGALPIEEACEIVLQACEALAEVHAAGIVHRDLKPSNLFVTRRADGSPAVKLLDFGISKLSVDSDEPDPALTATATIMGSPSYMSPEQLKSTKEVDARADVWSLGAVLYEAITGKPAFRAESVPQVCAMIASEPPRPPSSHREGIPPRLEQAVLECLEKDADKRIALVDLAHVLARFAPERARPSLERLEAVVGPSSRAVALRSRPEPETARDDLPVLPLATAERQRTVSSWGRRQGEERRRPRSSGGTLAVLVLGIAGGVGVAAATGRMAIPRWSGSDLQAASSLVSSAASAMSSALGPLTPPEKASAPPPVAGGHASSPSGAPPAPSDSAAPWPLDAGGASGDSSGTAFTLPFGLPSSLPFSLPSTLPFGTPPPAEDDDEADEGEDADAATLSDAGRAAVLPSRAAPKKHPSKTKHPSKRRHHT